MFAIVKLNLRTGESEITETGLTRWEALGQIELLRWKRAADAHVTGDGSRRYSEIVHGIRRIH